MRNARNPAGVIPPEHLTALARAYVDVHGLARAVRDLDTSRQSLLAVLAGQRVRRGTIAILAAALRGQGTGSAPPPRAA